MSQNDMEVDAVSSDLHLVQNSNSNDAVSHSNEVLDLADPVNTASSSNNTTNQFEIQIDSTDSCDVGSKEEKKLTYDDDDDGSLCPICLDNWTNSGEHRICTLKCGHVFCYKCVSRWLNTQQQKSCPTCKKKASKADIRFIYAKKLIAIDNTEVESMREQLAVAVEEKNKIQLELSKYVCREDILKQEILQLQNKIFNLSKTGKCSRPEFTSREKYLTENLGLKLHRDKSLEICRQNGCRVFCYSGALDLITVSAKSPNNLFHGYGIRKVNMTQYKPLAFVPLHGQQIRDVCFHPSSNWLLTASMDKSFKVVDMNSNKVMFTSSQNMPLWACCWDSDNQYILYIGTQSGNLVKYDVRNLEEPICTLSITGDMSPVVSIASIPSGQGDLTNGALISCKLNALWMFENEGNSYKHHPLPLNGPFVSMKYHKHLQQLLVSSRPNNMVSYSRHALCTLNKNSSGDISCNTIHSFQGGGMQKLLSKSCFISDQHDYIAAYEESNRSVLLWSINTGEKVCSISANDAVLDLSGIQNNSGNFLVSLTEKKMDFFKFS